MTLGQKLKARRLELNLTQKEVAEKVGVATQTIFKYENEIVTNMPLDRLELLANVLDLSPSYLMGWEKTETKNDAITDIILRLRADEAFLDIVKTISSLDQDQLTAVSSLIHAFKQ